MCIAFTASATSVPPRITSYNVCYTKLLRDEAEGADMLMVKPALAFMDVISSVRQESRLPLVCYNVSGEYSMVKAAAERGWLDEKSIVLENLTSLKRARNNFV